MTNRTDGGDWMSRAWILYPILLFVTLGAWAVSSPSGSSPDEDFHLISSWCALGERPGICTAGTESASRMVPTQLISTSCYQFNQDASGACPTEAGFTETMRGNFAAQYYPNGYYAVTGLLASQSVDRSVLLIRLLNAAIYSLGIAALLALAAPERRTGYMLGSVATLVPLGLFVIASVNPSSWAATAATLTWAAVAEARQPRSVKHRLGLAMLALAAVVLAFASRADAAVFAIASLVLAALAYSYRRPHLVAIGLLAVPVGVAALLWLRSIGSFSQAIDSSSAAWGDWNWLLTIQAVPGLYFGVFGTSYLGWLDTPIEPITWVLASGAFAMLTFWGMRIPSRRKVAMLTLAFFLAATYPTVLGALRPDTLIQSRYLLPIVIVIGMIVTSGKIVAEHAFTRMQAATLAAMLATAQANALHTNLRRYLTGMDDLRFDLNQSFEWWWPWAPPPMVIFTIGAIAFGLSVAVATGSSHCRVSVDCSTPPRRAH